MPSFRIIALLLVLFTPPLFPQAPSASPGSAERKTSQPYSGDLSIFESPGRAERLQIDRVMDILALASGKSVADIGAGSGWFSVQAARRVAPTGVVFAVDINPEATRYIKNRAATEKLTNIQAILSDPDDPGLAQDSVDAALLLKTYHEVAHPVTLLRNLSAALKPGALVGVIDRNGNGANHGVSKDTVIREAAEAGFSLVSQYDFVKPDDMDYFLVFSRKN